jgi:CRP-like cAMP-binding protein
MILSDVILRKLAKHSRLETADIAALRQLSCHLRELEPGEDFICQGDKPRASAIVMEGMVGRYHTLRSGGRQYLSVHLPGDWPDAQGLFLERMDHSVCALGPASLCAVPHADLIKVFRARPAINFAVWRETLIDAAIFREAITNNGSRQGVERIAHFFCEVYHRAKAIGLVEDSVCSLPLSQTQLGEMLGMSLISTARHLKTLRARGAADFRNGALTVHDFAELAALADFDPSYLHPRVQVLR